MGLVFFIFSAPREWMSNEQHRLQARQRMVSLRWCHNGRDSVSNHQPHDCLLNRLFIRRSKKTSKLRVTGLCVGNSPWTGEFPAQMASNAENVSIWWRHHVLTGVDQISVRVIWVAFRATTLLAKWYHPIRVWMILIAISGTTERQNCISYNVLWFNSIKICCGLCDSIRPGSWTQKNCDSNFRTFRSLIPSINGYNFNALRNQPNENVTGNVDHITTVVCRNKPLPEVRLSRIYEAMGPFH